LWLRHRLASLRQLDGRRVTVARGRTRDDAVTVTAGGGVGCVARDARGRARDDAVTATAGGDVGCVARDARGRSDRGVREHVRRASREREWRGRVDVIRLCFFAGTGRDEDDARRER
jgi:hypothetical protein